MNAKDGQIAIEELQLFTRNEAQGTRFRSDRSDASCISQFEWWTEMRMRVSPVDGGAGFNASASARL